MRLNKNAFDRTLKTDGAKYTFWHYTSSTETYDADTQLPTREGSKIYEYADVLDFTFNEVKNAAGLIFSTSKKFIVSKDSDLVVGDEVLNQDDLEIYRFVDSVIFANRKHLFANRVTENGNQH